MTKEEIISQYNALLLRAIDIVGAPDDGRPVRLDLADDGEAVLSWSEDVYSHGDSYMETEQTSFEASLLDLSDDDFDEWKAARTAKREMERAAFQEAARCAQERREREMFEALRAKFGG